MLLASGRQPLFSVQCIYLIHNISILGIRIISLFYAFFEYTYDLQNDPHCGLIKSLINLYFKSRKALYQNLMPIKLMRVLKEHSKNIIPLIWPVFSISLCFFLHNEFQTFLVFVMLIPIFTINSFDGRIPLAYGILLLIAVALLTFINQVTLADQLAIFSYWLLIVGISCMVIENYKINN